MERYAESMKDLKQLLEVDGENPSAKGEYNEVKQLWEKQLRQLQASSQKQSGSQKQRGKKVSHSNKKKHSPAHKNKVSSKESEKSVQQKELEQLLAETKNKMKALKKEVRDPSSFPEDSSEYLSASKTTYYSKPHGHSASQGSSVRRRKVVVEEEEEEGEGEEEGRKGEQPSTVPATETSDGEIHTEEKRLSEETLAEKRISSEPCLDVGEKQADRRSNDVQLVS